MSFVDRVTVLHREGREVGAIEVAALDGLVEVRARSFDTWIVLQIPSWQARHLANALYRAGALADLSAQGRKGKEKADQ